MTRSTTEKEWLEGVAAFEAKTPRDANPYLTTAGITTAAEINQADVWFRGYDTASIIITGDLADAKIA